MGACGSATARRTDDDRTASYKPCPAWTSETPMTVEDLARQRDEFWGTQPSFGGDPAVWSVLRDMCALPFKKQKAALDAAHLSVPTGRIIDGCYDELGRLYVIPPYCLSEPENLIRGAKTTDTSSKSIAPSVAAALAAAGAGGGGGGGGGAAATGSDPSAIQAAAATSAIKNTLGAPISLTFRFSSGSDLHVDTKDGVALADLIPQMNLSPNTTPRFFLLGKELNKKIPIKKLEIPSRAVIQAMLVSSIKVN